MRLCLPPRLTRRHLLLGAAATVATALMNACGGARSATDTPRPAAPTTVSSPAAAVGTAPPRDTAVPAIAPTVTAPLATATVTPTTAATTLTSLPTAGAASAASTSVSTTPRIVFVGGFLTAAPLSGDNDKYQGQVIRLLAPAKYDAITVASNGRTTATILTMAPKNVDPLYEVGRIKNIVVMWEGSDDLYQGAGAEKAYANLANFCSARRAVGWKVVILTILPRTAINIDLVPARAHFEADRQTVNNNVRSQWRGFADALADIAANPEIGADGAQNNPLYYPDGVYAGEFMKPPGYAIVAGIVKDAILTL